MLKVCKQPAASEHPIKQLAAEHSRRDDAPRVALVEIPPYGEPGRAGERESAVVFGRLADAAEWFASTPVVLQLSNGIVTRALEGKSAEAFQPG